MMGAGAAPGSIQAMLGPMIALAFPACLICIGIALMAYRRRDRSPSE
jgi:hypothetical protein